MVGLCGGADIFGLTILLSAVVFRSVATSGDDPGPGVEPDNLIVRVRGERIAQRPDRTRRGGGIQPLQHFAGAGEAADAVQGGGHVRAV
jgi:hypothetical protein